MPKKRTEEKSFQEPVRITETQARLIDGLIGMYGSTRGEVMRYFIVSELDRLDERRPIARPRGRSKR